MNRPRGADRSALLGFVLLLSGFALAGCGGAASGDTTAAASAHTSSASAAGQVALAFPVELRQVLAMSPCTTGGATPTNPVPVSSMLAPPTTLHDVDGVDCYQVSAPLLVLQQLNSIDISSQPPASQWVITMTMTPSDTQSFATVTEGHAGQEFAFVVRDTVLSAHTIPQQVTNGTVQIAGNFTQEDATRLMRQITG